MFRLRHPAPEISGRCLHFVLLAAAVAAPAQTVPLRVMSWRLEPPAAGSTNTAAAIAKDRQIQPALEALRQAGPDVILLRGAVDWGTCLELVEQLKPLALKPVACSTFKTSQGHSVPQAAILARLAPVVSWTEPWRNDASGPAGGTAFAAIRFGTNVVGFCSLATDGSDRNGGTISDFTAPLVRQLAASERWAANRVTSFIVAGSLPGSATNRAQAFEEARRFFADAGFASTLLPSTDPEAGGTSLFLVKNGSAAGELRATGSARPAGSSVALFSIELNRATTVQWVSATPPEPVIAMPVVPREALLDLPWLGVGGGFALGLLVVAALLRLRARRRQGNRLPVPLTTTAVLTDPSSAGAGPEAMRTALLPHLAGILREKFVAALMSHRTELLETQKAGAVQAEALEERLEKVQRELQERVRGFERRIAELELALAVAEEEKRGLIKAQIDLTRHLLEQARKAEHESRFRGPDLADN